MGVSHDGGLTWVSASLYQSAWGAYFASNATTMVSVGSSTTQDGTGLSLYTSRSTDGGLTWTVQTLATGDYIGWQGVVYNGTQFIGFQNGWRWQSSDGVTWSKTAIVSPTNGINAAITYEPSTGTYVGISNAWTAWYSKQFAYRSKDGLTWTVLDTQHFKGGHPITNITSGRLPASACQ
jgi:hypothetical protein